MASLLLTFNDSLWLEEIRQWAAICKMHGHVYGSWRIAAHKKAKPRDRVWVLKQGAKPRGIFAAGIITEELAPQDMGSGRKRWLAPISFKYFVDPAHQFLISEKDASDVLGSHMNARCSGLPLDDEKSARLEELLLSASIVAPI